MIVVFVHSGNPGVVAQHLEVTLIAGDMASIINVLNTGNPFPDESDVVYYYNDMQLTTEKSSEFGVSFLNAQKMVFSAVSYKHEGVYLVKVTTAAGTYNTSFTVHIAGTILCVVIVYILSQPLSLLPFSVLDKSGYFLVNILTEKCATLLGIIMQYNPIVAHLVLTM